MSFSRFWLPFGCLIFLFIACQQIEISTKNPNTNIPNYTHSNHIEVVAAGSGTMSDSIWPPKPANISNTGVLVGNNFALQTTNSNLNKASVKEVIMADSDLLNSLGNDYLLLDVNVSEQKNGALLQEVMLFSYTHNSTVRAWLNTGSSSDNPSVQYEFIAASDYQFPESEEEIAKSISLARAALVEQGFANAQTLNAHSMLTYPDETSGEQFYDVRMLYVTIGQGNGAVPDYAAWVDLSNNIVTNSGLIGSY